MPRYALRRQVIFGNLIILLLIVAIGVYTHHSFMELERGYRQLSEETVPLIAALQDLRFDALTLATTTNDTKAINELRSRLKSSESHYQSLITSYFPQEKAFAKVINGDVTSLLSLCEQWQLAREVGTDTERTAQLRQQMVDVAVKLRQITSDAMAYERDEVSERTERIDREFEEHIDAMLYSALALLVTFILITWVIARRPCPPAATPRDKHDHEEEGSHQGGVASTNSIIDLPDKRSA